MEKTGIFDQLRAKGLKTDLSNFDQFREFTNKQKRLKGFYFKSVVGTNEVRIDLSGTARLMLGLLFLGSEQVGVPNSVNTSFSLIVNNEVVMQDVGVFSLHVGRYGQNEFFEYLRILSGTDSIKIQFTDVASTEYRVQFYYV